MNNVKCARCGASAEGLTTPPLPGEVGQTLVARTCAACWKEWLGEQVKWINEYQLNPSDPEHYERLLGGMREYLKLGEAPDVQDGGA